MMRVLAWIRERFITGVRVLCAAGVLVVPACTRQAVAKIIAPTPSKPVVFVMDTGRMAVGHRDFARYDTPGKCLDAVVTERDALWRNKERDTLPYAPETDTLPAAAVQIGKQCGSRFTVEGTEPRELANLVVLLLMENEDDLARSAVERQIALAKGVDEQGKVLFTTLNAYMEVQPMRKAGAVAVLNRLDSLGRPVLLLRVAGHAVLEQDALRRFDRQAIQREAETIIADAQGLTPSERDDELPAIRTAYTGLVSLTWYEHPADIPALYMRVQNDLGPLRNGTGANWLFGMPLVQVSAITTQVLSMLGSRAEPLRAQYWFGAGPDTVRPRPGVVSLLARVDKDCGMGCYPLYAILQRLNRKYAAKGLRITLMTKTAGYSPGSAPETPAVEAEAARKYFLDVLHLPFALAVFKTPFTRQPDGRRVDGPVQFEKAYLRMSLVVADRAGKTVLLSDDQNEAMIDAFVQRALNGSN